MSWGNEIDLRELNNYLIEDNIARGRHMFGFGQADYFFDLKCEKDFLEAYNRCSPLKAIIAKRAKAFNSGKRKIVNTNTGKEATGRSSLKSLIKKPNVLQSEDQFFSQQNHYIDIFGYCPVILIYPAGVQGTMLESEPSSMWNIPPWLFDIDYTNKWLSQFAIEGIYKEYFMWWQGEKIALDMRNVKFIFDDGIGTECDSNLTIPDSRLISLEYPVSNIIAAYKSRNTLITKRGAMGILSNDAEDESGSVAMRPGDREQLQSDFKRYGLVGQPYQVIVSDAKLSWQQMGFPTSELMLFEEIEDDIDRLCDSYGYPHVLIASATGTTFENQKVGRRDLIENTIVPESQSRMQQFSKIVAPDDTIEIVCDYSGLTVFQEDAKLKAESRLAIDNAAKLEYDNNLITRNQWLERLGEQPSTDPEFDKLKNQLPVSQDANTFSVKFEPK